MTLSENSEVLLKAFQIRTLEEQLLALFGAGKISGTIHTCIGQELTGLAVARYLETDDIVISNHRCHGHYLARYNDSKGLIAEILGKPSGVCKGFGGSQHLYRRGFYSSGIQGGMMPSATGFAFALAKKKSKAIVSIFLGDGTLGQGVVYECLNIASRQKLPLLVVLENNRYAQSTAQAETTAGSIEQRFTAFGWQAFQADTFSLEPLFQTADKAIKHVRSGEGPAVLILDTYRLGPHSKGDDFRDNAERQSHLKKDLVHQFMESAVNDKKWQTALDEIKKDISSTINTVIEEAFTIDIRNSTQVVQKAESSLKEVKWDAPQLTQVKAINQVFHELFGQDPEMMMIGEDLRDPYGGTFKITKGLSDKYPDRIINMPISEASIVGVALGLAMAGKHTIAEIMFGDFLAIAFDQILNHAAKLRSMFGTTFEVPLLIRTPMGGGRGYGPTHSQCLEKYLVGVPQIDLYVLHGRVRLEAFYRGVMKKLKQTAIVIENKILYGVPGDEPLPDQYRLFESSDQRAPMSCLIPNKNADMSVVCFGGLTRQLESAMRHLNSEEIFMEAFYPLQVNAFNDISVIVDSVRRTGKLAIIEEGTDTGGLSAEWLRRIVMNMQGEKLPKIRIIASQSMPIPAASYLEEQVLPFAERIKNELLDLFDE